VQGDRRLAGRPATEALAEGGEAVSTPTATTEKRTPAIAEQVADLVVTRSTLVWDGEHAYAVVQEADHVRTLPVGSRAFRRWVQAERRRLGLSPPSREAFLTAEQSVEGYAEAGGVDDAPSIRVAGKDGVIYIDLGDDDWNCVRVTDEGWTVEKHPIDGPYMYRPPRMASLPEPEHGGKVTDLWPFVNVLSNAERVLLIAALVQMLWPRGPYPVLVFFGEQGSAKTTAQEMLKALVDPSRPNPDKHSLTSLRKPPRDERDVTAAAYGARVIGFDNVSYLDEWLSDTICRLSTGADLGGRELYSDFDEAIVSAVRPVMINGIPEVVGKADLADRAIKLECVRPERRKAEADLWSEFAEARPRILGALLDLLSLAIRNYGTAVVPTDIDVRMIDFARLGESIAPALGLAPGQFTQAFHDNRVNAAREVAELDSITPALRVVLASEDNDVWEGSANELLEALEKGHTTRHGSGWWSSAKSLANHLRRESAPLHAVGIKVEKLEGSRRSPISGESRTLYRVSEVAQG
jgi:putative DNA primase/helicase